MEKAHPYLHVVLELVFPYIKDRASMSEACKLLHKLDSDTRRNICVPLCFSMKPGSLVKRFPNLVSLKIKGKPRLVKFERLPLDFGGRMTSWVEKIQSLSKLTSLHLRRVIVSDRDLTAFTAAKNSQMLSLKLDTCSGFSTTGLMSIARNCRNLRTLMVEDCAEIEFGGEDWFRELAFTNNYVLRELNLNSDSLNHINIGHLEHLTRRCPLKSVKLYEVESNTLDNFFRLTPSLEEFFGGSTLPGAGSITRSLGLVGSRPIGGPSRALLTKLNLCRASLSHESHCKLIQRCPNLEVLVVKDIIGDNGLEVVGRHCPRLLRLRVEDGPNYGVLQSELDGMITERGLLAITKGCRKLEYLSVYTTSVNNESLVLMGRNLRSLNDFRLVQTVTHVPNTLDDGVAALLRGCPNLKRFALKVLRGGLTNTGMGYLGLYGKNIKWMLLSGVGENDEGLHHLGWRCARLQKLELMKCPFTARGLASVVPKLPSLRYMWVDGYNTSQQDLHLFRSLAPDKFWNVEAIAGRRGDLVPSHIFGYYSLNGPRTDRPHGVYQITGTGGSTSLRTVMAKGSTSIALVAVSFFLLFAFSLSGFL